MTKISSFAIVVFCFFAFCSVDAAVAVDVYNVADLQTALITAQSNGQDDTIILHPGIYMVSSPLTYTGADLENFSVTIQGAGAEVTILDGGNVTSILQIEQRFVSDGTKTNVTIRGITFRNGNESSLSGGALFVGNSNAETTIEDCVFQNNTAFSGGGALDLELVGGTSHLTGNIFTRNSSTDLSSVGGAVSAQISGGTLSLDGNTFINNFSVGSGGGLYATDSGPIVLTDNIFSSNVAEGVGGGAYLYAPAGGSLTLSGNTFDGNSGSSSGGVSLASDTGPIVISGNIFHSNNASASSQSNGGGLAANSQNSLKMVNNLFSGNTTSGRGAGAMLDLSGTNENPITNNTFVLNAASSQGGGMYVITEMNNAVLDIYNNIFSGNTAAAPSHGGADFYINDDGLGDGVGSTVKLYNNDYSNMDILRGNHLFQGSYINANPKFDANYRLMPGSPCIDTGTNSAPGLPGTDLDLGGDPRIQNAIVDMGAYEYGPRGLLQVTISPPGAIDVGAQWQVDGGPWHASGDTVSLLAGSYTMHFSDEAGWSTPPDQPGVTINSGLTTGATGVYTAMGPTGSLTVTMSPPAAITGGAQWQVDGGPWHASGDTQSGLSVGQHTVWFSPVPGLMTPGNQTVTVSTDVPPATATGVYGGHIGTLKVTILSVPPALAVSAGAHWQVDGGPWHASGDTQTVSTTGSHRVHFSNLAAPWVTPADVMVTTIIEGQTTNASGTYTQPTGSLLVRIAPPEAIAAGAQWQVDGGAWHVSGETQTGLSVGLHTVAFSVVAGWTTPGDVTVGISQGHTNGNAIGTYTAIPLGDLTVTITPDPAIAAGGQWRVDGGDWHGSGDKAEGLTEGNHALSFKPVIGWAPPADRPVAIIAGKTTSVSGMYTVVTATGSLKVTILPPGAVDVGAMWRRVGTTTWLASGTTESGIPVFNYMVEFSPVPGWITPDNVSVTIIDSQTTTAGATYTAMGPTGSLTVTIGPVEAVNGGAKWRVDGGLWQVSGYTQMDVSVGLHTIWFIDLPGWNTPQGLIVTINAGPNNASGTYAAQTGSLVVNINPPGAVAAGAMWRRVGTTMWLPSGTPEMGILVGNYTVEFADAPNWWTPGNMPATINNNGMTTITVSYTPQTGSLNVTINPPEAVNVGAKWRRVGTTTWRNSGTTESGIQVGLQTVEFNPASGYTKPDNLTVTIVLNQTTNATGLYTPPSGSLQVTISPDGAIIAGAQWQVDGGPWHGSGETQTKIPSGMHTVVFSTVAGYTKPGNRTVTINIGATTTTTGPYAPQTGSLRVTITPPEAVSAGAQWRRVGTTTWRNSGTTESGIPVGPQTVEFNVVQGWATSGNRTVTVNYNQTASLTVTYAQQTGSLQVMIDPLEAVNAGAKWQVDGGAWQVCGSTLSGLPVGTHTVTFLDLSNWTEPPTLTVTIDDSHTTTAWATYTPPSGALRVTISPQGAADAGAMWRVNGGPWQVSGYTQTGLPAGSLLVEYSDAPGWKTPANRTVAITIGRTASVTGTYVARTGSLQVTLSPPGAVSAGAQWRRVGTSTWRSSGTTETGIVVGQYTIEFSTASGWTKPDNLVVTIIEGQTTSANATYIPPSGSLQVMISPDGAIIAGALWRVDGGAWHASGDTQSGLSAGMHTVSFGTATGYTKPTNRTITIKVGQTVVVIGTYTP